MEVLMCDKRICEVQLGGKSVRMVLKDCVEYMEEKLAEN